MGMIFANFTPWQLLLWVAAFLMIVTPLLVMLVTSCVNGYFKAKERHMQNVASYIVRVTNAALDAALKTINEKLLNKEKKDEENSR